MNIRTKASMFLCLAGGTGLWLLPQQELEVLQPGHFQRPRAVRVAEPVPVVEPGEAAVSQPLVAANTAEQVAGNLLITVGNVEPFGTKSAEETMMSTWAIRDPEKAGRWMNENRDHPKYAALVRGYSIQLATIDPAAARQWAATVGHNTYFSRNGTLDRHIEEIEAMLKGPAAEAAPVQQDTRPPFIPDYVPALVRLQPGQEPVLAMRPLSPFG